MKKIDYSLISQMPRFQLLDEDELLEFVEGNDSKNTKKQIKYGLSVFLWTN